MNLQAPVHDPASAWLGEYTEARFRAAFAERALVGANVAAPLIGVDEKTLAEMTDALLIRATRRGKLRAYTERDLRVWLVQGEAPEKRDKDSCQGRSRQQQGRHRKVVPFTALAGGKPRA